MADFQSQVVEFTPIQGMSPIQNSNTGEDSDSCDDMKGPNNNKFNRTSDFNNNNHNHFNTSSTYGGITTNTGYGGITNISRPKGLDGVIEQDNNNTYSNQNQMGTSSVTGGKVKRTFKSSADLNVGGPVMNNLTNDFGNPSSLSNSPNTVTTVEINSGSIGVNPQSQTNSPPRPGGFGGVELPSKKSIKAMKLDAERKAAQQGGIGGGGFNSSFGGPGGPNVGMNTFNQNNQYQSYGNMAMQNGPIMQQQDSFNTTAAAATGGGIVDFSGNTNYQNNQFSATGTSTPAGLGSGSTGGGGGFGALPSSPPRPGKGGLPSAPSGGSVDMATYDSSNNNNNNNIGSSPPRPTFGGGGGGGSVLSVEGSMMGPTNQYGDNSNHNGIGSGGSSPLNYQQQQQYQQQGGMVMGNGFNQDNMSMNNNQQLPFPSASGFNNNSLPAGPGAPGPAKTNTLVENDMRVVDDDDSDSDDNPLSPQEQMMIQQAHQLGADQQSLQQQMQMQQQQGQNLTSQMDNSPGLAVPNPLQQVQPDDVNNLTNDISSTNINVNSTADMSSSTASQTLGVGQNPQFGPSVPPPVPDANNTASAQPSGTTTQGKKSKKPLPPLHAAQPLTIPTDRFAASLRFRKDFVLQPIPYNDRSRTLQARVVRVKEGLSGRMFPTYHLCVRNGPGQDETILLAAQKQTARKTLSGYYLITLDPRCFVKKSSTYVGKLRSNWTGTEYTLYSEGDNPKKSLKLLGGLSMPGFGRNSTNNAQQQAQAAAAAAAQQQQQQQQYLQHQNSMGMNANGMQQQQMAGTYDANGNYIPNGSPGLPPESPMDPNISEVREEMLAIKFSKPGNAPRRMVCVIPGPSVMNPYQRQVFRSKPYQSLMDYANGKENIVSSDGQGIQFMRFVSKSPVWDSRRQTFTINFYGKVRQPSSKNFQLMECDVRALQPNAHRDFIDAQQQQIQQQMAAAQAAQQAQAQQQQQQAMQQQGSQGNNNQMQQNNNLPQSQTQQQQVLSNGGPSVTGSTTGQGLNANSNGTVAGSTTNPMAATNNPISNPPPIPMMVGSQGPGVTDENPVVQFGRWTDEIFNLDGMWPFSIAQVFALALSTFDTRLQETLKMTY